MKYTILISALFLATASCSYTIPHSFSSTKSSSLPAYQKVGDVKVEECRTSSIFGANKEARYDNSYSAALTRVKDMGGDAIIDYEIINTDYLSNPFQSKNCFQIVGTAVKFTGGSSAAAAPAAAPTPSGNPQ